MKFCVLSCLKMDNFLIYNDNAIQTFVVIKNIIMKRVKIVSCFYTVCCASVNICKEIVGLL